MFFGFIRMPNLGIGPEICCKLAFHIIEMSLETHPAFTTVGEVNLWPITRK